MFGMFGKNQSEAYLTIQIGYGQKKRKTSRELYQNDKQKKSLSLIIK